VVEKNKTEKRNRKLRWGDASGKSLVGRKALAFRRNHKKKDMGGSENRDVKKKNVKSTGEKKKLGGLSGDRGGGGTGRQKGKKRKRGSTKVIETTQLEMELGGVQKKKKRGKRLKTRGPHRDGVNQKDKTRGQKTGGGVPGGGGGAGSRGFTGKQEGGGLKITGGGKRKKSNRLTADRGQSGKNEGTNRKAFKEGIKIKPMSQLHSRRPGAREQKIMWVLRGFP